MEVVIKSITLVAVVFFTIITHAQIKGTFKDTRDGKIYKTVTIGTQTWFAGNLAFKNSG